MNYRIEDLGVAGVGETTLDGYGCVALHPKTNEEYVLHPTMEHGFIAINPVRKTSVHVCPDRTRYERTSRGAAQAKPNMIHRTPYVLRDGGRVSRIANREVNLLDAAVRRVETVAPDEERGIQLDAGID